MGMYVNDRGQMNFHVFLKASRELTGVNQKTASEGICTESEWSRVEIGDRLPEKMMRDRIVSRTGISGEEFEEYLRPEEYMQWEWRMYTLRCMNNRDVAGVKKGIKAMDGFLKQNPVQKQFVDTMRYMLAKMQGATKESLSILIELAVVHTIPSVEYALKGTQLLADQELNLIAEYARMYDYRGENVREWRFDIYKKVLQYIDNSTMDSLSKAKVYPRVACLISELLLETDSTEGEIRYAYEMCRRAVELLQENGRLYYLVELMERRKQLNVRIQGYQISEEEKANLKLSYDKDTQWETVLKELYIRYELPIYMQNFTYLYLETVCESAVEVLRTRRNMCKLSRARLCVNICADRTLERFENYAHCLSIVVLRDLFERVGLCAEYRRTKIITDKVGLLELNNRIVSYLKNDKIEEAEECLEQLESQLDMDICYNKQEIKKIANRIALHKKVLEKDVLYRNALVALESTIAFGDVIRKRERYFTRSEMECLHDLAFKVNGEVSGASYAILLEMCEGVLKKPIDASILSTYEPIMLGFVNDWIKLGKYDVSYRYSERLMKECLTNYRSTSLAECLFNKTRIYEILSEPHDIPSKKDMVKTSLEDAMLLAEIAKNEVWTAFLQTKLSIYE